MVIIASHKTMHLFIRYIHLTIVSLSMIKVDLQTTPICFQIIIRHLDYQIIIIIHTYIQTTYIIHYLIITIYFPNYYFLIINLNTTIAIMIITTIMIITINMIATVVISDDV